MSEDRKEEQETQERQETAASEEDTRPLDAKDWEETRGEQDQEERQDHHHRE